jgi:hypothetical protein
VQMWKGLNSKHVAVLKYLCWSLSVLPEDGEGSGKNRRVIKKDYVEKLMGWVRTDLFPCLYLTDSYDLSAAPSHCSLPTTSIDPKPSAPRISTSSN